MDKELEKQIQWLHNKIDRLFSLMDCGGDTREKKREEIEKTYNSYTEPKPKPVADPKWEDTDKADEMGVE